MTLSVLSMNSAGPDRELRSNDADAKPHEKPYSFTFARPCWVWRWLSSPCDSTTDLWAPAVVFLLQLHAGVAMLLALFCLALRPGAVSIAMLCTNHVGCLPCCSDDLEFAAANIFGRDHQRKACVCCPLTSWAKILKTVVRSPTTSCNRAQTSPMSWKLPRLAYI